MAYIRNVLSISSVSAISSTSSFVSSLSTFTSPSHLPTSSYFHFLSL